MARLLLWPERHPGRLIAAIGLLFALAYSSSLVLLKKPDGRIVIGDAVHYFVYLRSAVFDGDLRFQNEYVRLYALRGGEPGTEWVYEPTATGHTRNLMSIGPALIWAPLYLGVGAVTTASAALAGTSAPDGFGRAFQASAGLSGVLAATIGAYLAFLAARVLCGPRVAIWSTLGIWLGSSAVYYSLVSPTYSHPGSMLATGALVYGWVSSRDRQTTGRYAFIGMLAGLCVLVRWQDVVLLALPGVEALVAVAAVWRAPGSGRLDAVKRAALQLSACAGAAAMVTLPQLAAWMILYGRPLLVPQGADFMQWSGPFVLKVLFDGYHGLVSWTPIVGLSLVGLLVLPREAGRARWALAVAFALSCYVNGSVADWWGGEAFGARRFISCFPIFVIGLAAVFARARASLVVVASVVLSLVAFNGLLLLQYQLFMHGLRDIAPYPGGFYNLWLARFVVPFDLIGWWLAGPG